MKRKSPALTFIQLAWVIEVIAVILYTMVSLLLLTTERVSLWMGMLPSIIAIIGSQGAAAGAGPLISDYIKSRTHQEVPDGINKDLRRPAPDSTTSYGSPYRGI
jgi:Na+/glutamate symporter